MLIILYRISRVAIRYGGIMDKKQTNGGDMNETKREKQHQKMLKKQQKLMEKLIRENNERIMAKRGYLGLYDKRGRLTEKYDMVLAEGWAKNI